MTNKSEQEIRHYGKEKNFVTNKTPFSGDNPEYGSI